jgi:integrase
MAWRRTGCCSRSATRASRSPTGPLTKRWRDPWDKAGLTPLGLHEARHTAASLFIAAGLNAKTVATYLGHANIAVTFDRYGHLFPGSEDEARGLLDTYLEGA